MAKQKRVVFDYIDSLLKDDKENPNDQMIIEIIEIDLTDTDESAPAAEIEEPLAETEEPSAVIEEPSAVIEEPSAIIEEPSAITEQSSIEAEEDIEDSAEGLADEEPEPSGDLITDDEFESLLDELQATGQGAFAAPPPSADELQPASSSEEELSDEAIAAMMEASREADLAAAEPETLSELEIAVASEAELEPQEPPIEHRAIIKAVLIDMHGMKLALPQDQMEAVFDFESVSMSISGLPDWVIGRVESERSTLDVVDTAQWLIPEKYKPEYAEYQQFVVLPGRIWALACDGLVKSIEIPHDELNWNMDRSERGWLIGTYMPERCALIDVPYLVEAFTAKVE